MVIDGASADEQLPGDLRVRRAARGELGDPASCSVSAPLGDGDAPAVLGPVPGQRGSGRAGLGSREAGPPHRDEGMISRNGWAERQPARRVL